MNKQATRRSQPKRRPQQRKGRTAMAAKGGKGTNRMTWILVGVVLVVGIGLLIAVAGAHKDKVKGIKDRQPAPSELISKVTGVSQDTINSVGAGSTVGPPKKVNPSVPVLTKDGKPLIVYMGAEYCPFCAAERWGMLNALSRFGKFKDLSITTSSSTDIPATIPTLSFHGSKYDSPYIAFEPVEQQTNTSQPLDQPTADQQALAKKYDVAPYTSRDQSIPFVDFANQYIVAGASYDANKLQGMTHQEIADQLNTPSSDVSRGAIGTANGMTAAICKLTNNKPGDVCTQPAIKDIQKQL